MPRPRIDLAKPRRYGRVELRLACTLFDGGDSHEGIVRDLSEGGLFVVTSAAVVPGTQVSVEIPADGEVPALKLRAIVVRHCLLRSPTARLISVGVGLRLLHAPPEFYDLLDRHDCPLDSDEDAGDQTALVDTGMPVFSVTLKDKKARAVETLLLIADNADEVRDRLKGLLGRKWKIADVEPVGSVGQGEAD